MIRLIFAQAYTSLQNVIYYLDVGKFMFLSYGHNISYSTANVNLQNMKQKFIISSTEHNKGNVILYNVSTSNNYFVAK